MIVSSAHSDSTGEGASDSVSLYSGPTPLRGTLTCCSLPQAPLAAFNCSVAFSLSLSSLFFLDLILTYGALKLSRKL